MEKDFRQKTYFAIFFELFKTMSDDGKNFEEIQNLLFDKGILDKEIKKHDKEIIDNWEQTYHQAIKGFKYVQTEQMNQWIPNWQSCFDKFDFLLLLVLDAIYEPRQAYQKMEEEKKEKKKYTMAVCLMLFTRIIQVYVEISTLLRNGLADGAFSRWRSLYEFVIILSFITKNGEKAAIAYYKSIENEKTDYSWAKPFFNNKDKDITFPKICRICPKYLNFEFFYKKANHVIHSCPIGFFDAPSIVAGLKRDSYIWETPYGLSLPASLTTFNMISALNIFRDEFSKNFDFIHKTFIINKWADIVRKSFSEQEKTIPPMKNMVEEILNKYSEKFFQTKHS